MKNVWTLILFIIFISGCDIEKIICVNEKCFKVQFADDLEERRIGLMNHDELASDSGMFFIFDNNGKHSIWMKNMKFPIDIIWIDSNYNVVDIKRNAEPCDDECQVYSPSKDAKYVLETNINSNIQIGDKVERR